MGRRQRPKISDVKSLFCVSERNVNNVKKKAYIAWEENDSSSSYSPSDSDEETNIYLMADGESTSNKVSNFSDPNEYYELHATFN